MILNYTTKLKTHNIVNDSTITYDCKLFKDIVTIID
jgi:hypothetical protein